MLQLELVIHQHLLIKADILLLIVLRKVQSGDINGNDRLNNRNDEVAAKNNGWLGCTNYGLIITI